MSKNKNEIIIEEKQDEMQEENGTENTEIQSDENSEMDNIKAELEDKTKKSEEYYNSLQRTMADFDNFRKRTARERESLYTDVAGDVVAQFLPVIDNVERAVDSCREAAEATQLLEGIEMVLKQLKDTLNKLGVEEIQTVGSPFNPLFHNAVMHIEDEQAGENEIVEEFQKGYKLKDKVIRHSMVKVAN